MGNRRPCPPRPPGSLADLGRPGGPPGGGGVSYLDVVVSHPIHRRGTAWTADACGQAALRADADKRRDYRAEPGHREVHLVPLSFETGGRWGDAAERLLLDLARGRMAAAGDDAGADLPGAFSILLGRWRQEALCTLLRGNWGVYSSSLGGGAPGVRGGLRPGHSLAVLW